MAVIWKGIAFFGIKNANLKCLATNKSNHQNQTKKKTNDGKKLVKIKNQLKRIITKTEMK